MRAIRISRADLFLSLLAVLLAIALAACSGPQSPIATPTVTPSQAAGPGSGPTSTALPGPVATETPEPTSGVAGPPPAKPLQSPSTPTPAPPPGVTAAFPDAPARDLYRLANELLPDGHPQMEARPISADPAEYTQGREDTFWLVDLRNLEMYQRPFELRLVTPNAYWYFERGQSISQRDIEQAAAAFEETIYPGVTAIFGDLWPPGVGGSPRLNILNAPLRGAGGYYSSSDEYPQSIFPFSNQRKIIYINTVAFPVGTPAYLEVLAHELQHAIHWNYNPSEDTWVNEGLSELASALLGYPPRSISRYLTAGPTSLVHWPLDGASVHYGSASLFMHYLAEHYGDRNNLRPLVSEPTDGITGIDAYLKSLGHQKTFRDVFRDWVVANFLDQAQGVYGYRNLEVQARVHQTIAQFSEIQSQIPQYAVEYIELTDFRQPVRLRFQGTPETRLLPVEVGPTGCWWSNSGDSISSTLTRAVDLSGLQQATLSYQVWYNIERNWDYGYVQVSTDGGRRWHILQTPHTSEENPIGNSFGPGYTGNSRDWLSESVDLTPYAGQEIHLRFQYVTDDAINGAGLCFREITVAEAGLHDGDNGWQAEGFVLTSNRVLQDYFVQVIERGTEDRVTLMSLDEDRAGELVIETPQGAGRLVVAVASLAPKTLQPAPYTLIVEPVN